MNVTLEDIRAFLAVARLESFSQAAERLAVSQSALTRRIQKIEEHLGVRVFNRSTRRVELTAVGKEFMPLADRMVGEFERSLGQINDVIEKRHGLVTIASLMTVAFGLLPLVAKRFQQAHPMVRMRVLDATGRDISDHVRSGEAEFGIDMEGEPDAELAFEPLADERYVIACRPDHPLAGRTPIGSSEIAGHACVTLGSRSAIGRQLRETIPALDWQFEVQHLSTVLGYLNAGLGVAAIPSLALRSIDQDSLSCRPLIDPKITRSIGIIRRRGMALSPAALSLRELIRAEFASFRTAQSVPAPGTN